MLDPHFISVYNELNIFCLIILAIIGLGTRIESSDNATARSHTRAILATCAFIVTDALWFTMNSGYLPGSAFSLMTLKSLYFLSTTFMCYCWFICFERRQGITDEKIGSSKLYVPSLVAIHLVLLVANAFFGFFFRYDGLTYVRGPLFLSQYILSYGYVLLCSAMALKRAIADEHFSERERHIALALFPVPPAICGVIQYFAPFLPCACCGMTISAPVMYLNSLTQLVSRDALTGLPNRLAYQEYLKGLERRTDDSAVTVYSMDVNGLKGTNDSRGHLCGDILLRDSAACILKVFGDETGKNVFRIGGDEFAAICLNQSEADVARMLESFREEQAHYSISISVGYAHAKSLKDEKLQKLFERADQDMYGNKTAAKKNRE